MGRTRPDLFQGSFFMSEFRLHICLILFNYDCA